MPRYKTKRKIKTKSSPDSGYDSGYESDGGTEYSPVEDIGVGGYAKARLFQSQTKKSVVVLNPVTLPGDFGEAILKQRFFQTVYPDKQSHLFSMRNKDYRLIVPYISHVPYEKLKVDTPEFQKLIFRSAIEALIDCHAKGIIMVDLKSDNIYYDSSTQKSYLIDGGSSALRGTSLDPLAFQKSSQEKVEEFKEDYSHIAPECWSVKPKQVLATSAMDVYSLGKLMEDILLEPDIEMRTLIDSCLKKDPGARPTLKGLLNSLDNCISEKENIISRLQIKY